MTKSINKVIKNLIYSDVFLLAGLGLVVPIFAIFLTERIEGGTIEVAGFAAAIYWLVYSLVMVPVGKFLDKKHGEKDDLWALIIGNFLAALAVFGYFFAKYPWHIYVLQAIYGMGMSMNMASYTAIFTRHIDKGKESFEWSVRGSLVGVGSGIAGGVGGWVAYNFGFNVLFTGVIIFILLSSLLPIFVLNEMRVRDRKMAPVPETKIMPPSAPKE